MARITPNDENENILMNGLNSTNNLNKNNLNTPSPKKLTKPSRLSTKTLLSDAEYASDSSDFSFGNGNGNSPRRNRKTWTEDEEACLISGVAKHGENWEAILIDNEYSFNFRISKDLRLKYRSLIKNDTSSSSSSNNNSTSIAQQSKNEFIFDIRTINEKVTEVFIGTNWSSAQWTSSENVQPLSRFEILLADFEKKISAKQRLISRISPARTPSRFISSLAINGGNSAVKRRPGSEEFSEDENMMKTPLKKTKSKQLENSPMANSSPLSIRSVKSSKSNKSIKSNKSKSNKKSLSVEALLVHSDSDAEAGSEEYENEVIFPNEQEEPVDQSNNKNKTSRCIIM